MLWFGRERDLAFEVIGREHYDRLLGPTRGAIVVGAHLGSFDALRALAERDRRTVNVLMYTEHAPRINAVFRALSPDVQLRVIQVERDSMGTVLQIRSCIERGEIVAMLGDRVEPADRGRTCAVTLLGGRIEVPEAPYLLAGLLGCPLFFMVALRAPGPRYRVFAEVLAERVELGRGERDKRIPELAAAYAGRLEHYLLQAPYQWFNFYDVWAESAGGARSEPRDAMSRRVVITGMSGIAPIGSGWKEVRESLQSGRSGVVRMDAWDGIAGLQTRVAAPVPSFEAPDDWPRRKTRSMGRDSLLATRATELALADAGLLGHPALGDGRTGVAYGCTQGSPRALEVYARQFYGKQTTSGIRGSDFIRFMSHTCAANIAQFFGLRGRIIPTTSACTSGSQGIGYALRGDPLRPPGRDDRGRRRGDRRHRRRDLRHPARRLDAQRRAARARRARSTPRATAWWSPRARARSCSRSSSSRARAARGSPPRCSATAPTATACT